MKKTITAIIFLLFLVINNGFSQTLNYWGINLNSEAAMLGGAVVGGGAGVTSIFYNPAGISEIEQSNVTLNSSMFSMVNRYLKNALGDGVDMDHLYLEIQPRFVSYTYPSSKYKGLSWEVAVFNRDNRDIFLSSTYKSDATGYGYPGAGYTGTFDFWENYADYWGGIGASYQLTEKIKVGASLFASFKDYRGYNEVSTSISYDDNNDDKLVAGWYNYNLISIFNPRLLPKIGFIYYFTNEISVGVTVSFPSLGIYGYANGRKMVSHVNIKDNDGKPVNDFFKHEDIEYVDARLKDPLSVAVGVRKRPLNSRNIYSMTIEWFAPVKTYKAVDAENGNVFWGEEVYGTEFSDYYMGNRSVINFAFGYKREIRENLELMFGVRSDFYAYRIDDDVFAENKYANALVAVGTNYMHLTTGANFILLKKFKINLGGTISYGSSSDIRQLANFVDVNWYDYKTGLALQGHKKNNMTYRRLMLGLFLGFSLDF